MSGDIFEALDSVGFGGNVREIAAEGECRVLRIDGEDGEGFMTMYRVFDGVYLMYNDLHMKSCISEYQNASTVLCIEYRLVPLMVCSVNIGSELSAAALTRGLGTSVRRTNICKIGFHAQDVAVMAASTAVYILWILGLTGVVK